MVTIGGGYAPHRVANNSIVDPGVMATGCCKIADDSRRRAFIRRIGGGCVGSERLRWATVTNHVSRAWVEFLLYTTPTKMLMAVLWPRALSLMSKIFVTDCVPISRIIVGQGLPKIGCASTSAAVIGFRGSGR